MDSGKGLRHACLRAAVATLLAAFLISGVVTLLLPYFPAPSPPVPPLQSLFVGVAVWLLAGLIGFLEAYRTYRGQGYPPGHCKHCGYLLKGLPSPRCPECGTPIRATPVGEAQENEDGEA